MNAFPKSRVRSRPPAPVFFAFATVLFFTSLSAADSVGFVPCQLDDTCQPAEAAAQTGAVALSALPQLGIVGAAATSSQAGGPFAASGVEPTRLSIPAVGIDLPVQNPGTRDISALDALLKSGPVRYVDSAKLGESGNILIFAHSSHLPIVTNKMFQAFNKVPDLVAGDMIELTGRDGVRYLYSVQTVVRADTADGTTIDLSQSGKQLTLVTCDTLTGKSARFVLTAQFVGTVGT